MYTLFTNRSILWLPTHALNTTFAIILSNLTKGPRACIWAPLWVENIRSHPLAVLFRQKKVIVLVAELPFLLADAVAEQLGFLLIPLILCSGESWP